MHICVDLIITISLEGLVILVWNIVPRPNNQIVRPPDRWVVHSLDPLLDCLLGSTTMTNYVGRGMRFANHALDED